MYRDSTKRLIMLLLHDERAAIKWHSQAVPDAVRHRLSLPGNAALIAALAAEHWPPVASERAEVGYIALGALALSADHMINWTVETAFQEYEPEPPKMEDGVLAWWLDEGRRVYWWLLPPEVVSPVAVAEADPAGK